MAHSVEVDGSMASEVRKSKKHWVKKTRHASFGMQIQWQAPPKLSSKETALVSYPQDGIHIALIHRGKAEKIPELEPLLARLFAYCKGDAAKLEHYNALLKKMQAAGLTTLKHWTKILWALSKSTTDVQCLSAIQSHLEVQRRHLGRLVELFDYSPYPEIQQLTDTLKKYDAEVDLFIRNYNLDPKGARAVKRDKSGKIIKTTEAILNEQFDTKHVERIIRQIALAQSGNALSSREQYDLAQQVTYINAVGRKHPLTIKGLATGSETSTTYNDLTQQTRVELQRITNFLIQTIRKPQISAADKLKAQLNLLAVLREQYFRVTGRFANTTQLITVLMSLKNHQQNALLELGASEDSSMTNALVAVMKWVSANGGTVDLCTANREFVDQEYQEQGNGDFFSSLGIESARVQANSQKGTYKIGGINYSTVPDLALYRARVKLNAAAFPVKKEEHQETSNLILAQPDVAALRNQAYYTLVRRTDEADSKNSYAWLYLLINEFINLNEFKDLTPQTCWDNEQDLIQLKQYLASHSLSPAQKDQLTAVSDAQLNSWIDAAIEAQRLVEGVDFVIPESKTKEHIVIPKSQVAQVGFSFSQETQHFLSARLQNEHLDEGWVFTVEPETSLIVATFAKDLFNDYKERGHILGLSEALGTTPEVAEQLAQLNMERVYRIPTHSERQVKEHAPQVPRDSQDYLKTLKERTAIERYYLQRVAEVQEVVMHQFDDWYAFLSPFYTKLDLARLHYEFHAQKEQFARSIEAEWAEYLVQSNPDQSSSNPYDRRDQTGALLTDALDKAMHQFENAVEVMWNKQCEQLKSKTEGKIKEHSRQALHCDYLSEISIINELRSYRLAQSQKKLELAKERKKAHRHLAAGLDVNGAMISYSDGEVDSYKINFRESQVEFFRNDIAKHIENNGALSQSMRVDLVKQIRSARTLFDLVCFLNDYAGRWLPEARSEDKYELQPVVQQILFAYHQVGLEAGLEEYSSVNELREVYLDQVSEELADKLKTSLDWAVEGRRGLGYLLERTTVTTAAADILEAIKTLESVTREGRRQALKDLYKQLVRHQTQLAGLWIFSFGHKNTRTLINETLATLDGLTCIGSEDADFIKDAKEEAVTEVMLRRFATATEAVERGKSIKDKETWDTIRATLDSIQKGSNSICVLHEMNHFVVKQLENEQLKPNSSLVAPLSKLRGELRNIWHECTQNHKPLIDESTYFDRKAEKIKADLAELDGVKVEKVSLKAEDNGFSTYLDLVIEGTGTHKVLDDFDQYRLGIVSWSETRRQTDEDLQQTKDFISLLQGVKNKLLPDLKNATIEPPKLDEFPEQFYQPVVEILKMRAYAKAEAPNDISVFEEPVQNAFHDYHLIKEFSVHGDETLAGEIAKLRDPELRNEFTKLYQKIHQKPEAPTLRSRFWSAVGWSTTQETQEDLTQQFSILKCRPEQKLTEYFYPKINAVHDQLLSDVEKVLKQTREKQTVLETKSAYATEKVAEEKAKGGVYHKRFKNMEAFYEFIEELKAHKPKEAPKAPVSDVVEQDEFRRSPVL